jgi:hypothetical protein
MLRASIITVLVAMFMGCVEPHGRMMSPPSRTTMYVIDSSKYSSQQPYWNSYGVECDNQDSAVSTCGRCGGAPGSQEAKDLIQGGTYGKNIIVANYSSGSTIEIVSDKGAWHYGYEYFELCPQATESDGCFQKLTVVSANTPVVDKQRVCVANANGDQPDKNTAKVQLPSGVKCDRCTLRWTYRTAYPGPSGWTNCWVAPGGVQVFRNCADIRIS